MLKYRVKLREKSLLIECLNPQNLSALATIRYINKKINVNNFRLDQDSIKKIFLNYICSAEKVSKNEYIVTADKALPQILFNRIN